MQILQFCKECRKYYFVFFLTKNHRLSGMGNVTGGALQQYTASERKQPAVAESEDEVCSAGDVLI